MKPEYLYAFYEYMLLPQFGLENEKIVWYGSPKLGPDEKAHYFFIGEQEFLLIFEDFDGLGRNLNFIEEETGLAPDDYEFISPKSYTNVPPSFQLSLPTPYKYAPEMTGTFTLLKLRHPFPRSKKDKPIRLGIENQWGWVDVNETSGQ